MAFCWWWRCSVQRDNMRVDYLMPFVAGLPGDHDSALAAAERVEAQMLIECVCGSKLDTKLDPPTCRSCGAQLLGVGADDELLS